MTIQTRNIGINRAVLERQLEENGYWGTPERKKRYEYVLSPSAYVMSHTQHGQIQRLAKATYGAVKALSEKLTTLGCARTVTNEDAQFVSLARHASRGLLTPEQVGGAVPPVVKVDMMQDTDGQYHIAEIDSYNPRGLCYLAMLESTVPKGTPRVGGGMEEFAAMLKSAGESNRPWLILASDFERFYEPAFTILADSVSHKSGMEVRVCREDAIGSHLRAARAEEPLQLLMIPESLQDVSLRENLCQLYLEGNLRAFYAPTAYLGSKSFLPFLREQPGMNEFVPACSVVSKKHDPLKVTNGKSVVLKGSMSSGLKQVVFSAREPDRFASEYASARKTKRPVWIMQEEVRQATVPVEVFSSNGTEVQGHFLRLTAYITENGVLGVEVTGRPEPEVHGAPDCIQIPTVLA